MTTMPDPIRALLAFLKADADVAALAGTWIFGSELPPESRRTAVGITMPEQVVVVRATGGTAAFGGGYQEHGDFRADVQAYGRTPVDAWDLYLAVHPALKQLRREVYSSCLLHWAKPAGGPLQLRDPDTDWPFVLSVWQVLAAEVAAA